jgi:hypothetical protein
MVAELVLDPSSRRLDLFAIDRVAPADSTW